MTDRLQEMEERIAHLQKLADDLSDVVARQEQEIGQLTRRVDLLLRREAEREAAASESVVMADRPPPHW